MILQCEAPKIAKTPITMVYGTYNELVTGAFVNQQTSLGGLTLYNFTRFQMVQSPPASARP